MSEHKIAAPESASSRLRPPYKSVLDLIGQTPMVELTKFDTGQCRLFIKLESQNPGGSIKDRIALSMIAAAEKRGQAQARRHHRRGDRRQHRPRPRPGRHPQGLPHRAGRARQDVAREDPASARARRRGAHDALRCRQGPSRILPGHGREDRCRRCPAPSMPTSSPIPPTRWRTRRPPARKSWRSSTATSTRWSSASAPAAR